MILKARALVAIQFGLLGVLFLKPAGWLLSDLEILKVISTLLTIIAFVVFVFAYVALKPSLRVSPIPKPGAPLIVSGIYRWFRHPMYLGVLMIGLGFLLDNLNLASIVTYAFLFLNMVIKADYEDSLLRARHSYALEYQVKVFGLLGRKHA